MNIINNAISCLAVITIFLWIAAYYITTRYIDEKQAGIVFYDPTAKFFRFPFSIPAVYKTVSYCNVIFFKCLRDNPKFRERYFIEGFMSFIRLRDKVNAALVSLALYGMIFLLIIKAILKYFPIFQIGIEKFFN